MFLLGLSIAQTVFGTRERNNLGMKAPEIIISFLHPPLLFPVVRFSLGGKTWDQLETVAASAEKWKGERKKIRGKYLSFFEREKVALAFENAIKFHLGKKSFLRKLCSEVTSAVLWKLLNFRYVSDIKLWYPLPVAPYRDIGE